MKLTLAQQKAFSRTTDKWASAYSLRASMATLDALVRRGLLKKRIGLGSIFSPRTAVHYRRAEE